MQLSLPTPFPIVSDLTASGPSGANPLGGATSGAVQVDSSATSFETLLKGTDPDGEPVGKAEEVDTGNAASLLAASLWTPLSPLPPETTAAAISGQMTTSAAPTPASPATSLFAAAPSARAFTAVPAELSQSSLSGQPLPAAASGVAMPAALNDSGILASGPGRVADPANGNTRQVAPPAGAPLADVGTENPDPICPMVEAPVAKLGAENTDLVAAPNVAPAAARKPDDVSGVSPTATSVDEITQTGMTEGSDLAGSGLGVQTPADRSAKVDRVAPQEKTAAAETLSSETVSAIKQISEKYFLNSGYKPVNTRSTGIGISIAQVDSAMSAASPSRAKFELNPELMQNMPVAPGTPNPSNVTSTAALVPTASVRETMATVVSIVNSLERRDAAEQKSVNLQLKVGDEALALRVELRDGTVHTTFRTESPELRAALAHAWQSVTTQVENRSQRLAEPIFTTTHDGSPSAGDSSAQQQRDSGARQNLPQSDGFHRRRPAGVVATETTESPRPGLQSVSTNVHLHTFA